MAKQKKRNILDAIDQLAKAESEFVGSEFLSPVLRGAGVGVMIAGVRCRLAVSPGNFEGWGIFRAVSHTQAKFLRAPTLAQRRQYLALFPAVRLILTMREQKQWLGVSASSGDSRISLSGPAPVRFAGDDAELFDTVIARFDGSQLWFDRVDDRSDPATASYLRQSFTSLAEPDEVQRPALTAEQRLAYLIAYKARVEELLREQRARPEHRLKAALEHAGARLREYSEQGDFYRVSYDVDGRRHTSIVRKDDLAVVTAGICLSGRDHHFDLGSLVGVLREGTQSGQMIRIL
jgi:hypothetical protein